MADRYLAAIASTCALIECQPLLGPVATLSHPRLAAWRFFVVVCPFHRHVLSYEIIDGEVIMRRVLHGQPPRDDGTGGAVTVADLERDSLRRKGGDSVHSKPEA